MSATTATKLFRLWITRCPGWQPRHWSDVPPRAVAVELADDQCFSASEAAEFLEGFNRESLSRGKRLWAVAVPIRVQYQGDLQAGQQFVPDERC